MTLAPHTRLGPYEVVSALGAGGMGEVYRARDTRLDRSVAIKVLAEAVAGDAEMRVRFAREAKAVAALEHPHICGVYDVGEADGVHFLVMPLLDGQTLAARLEKGPVPIGQALTIASQLADALDKAHRRGIVHRDVKPANIMLTRSGATLLDFGLAKLKGPAMPISMSGLAQLATSMPGTAHGVLLGTVPYMAPEQVEGREADARSDVWALGAVIYEMASGVRPFQGESPASIIGAILKDTPAPLSTRQPLSPALLDRVVARCLEKDADERWQSATDLHHALSWVAEGTGLPPARAESRLPRWAALGIAVVAAALGVGAAAMWPAAPVPVHDVRFIVHPEPGSRLSPPPASVLTPQIALSHDGSHLAFVATADGRPALWVRPLAADTARVLPGTDGAIYPFWMPDNRTVGFFAQGQYKVVRIDGGVVVTISKASFDPRGGTAAPDGTTLMNTVANGGLSRVAADGSVTRVVPLDRAAEEVSLRFPFFLPDSRHFVAVARSGIESRRGIVLGTLEGGSRTRLVGSDWGAAVVDGRLLYLQGSTLMAQMLDVAGARLVGEAVPLLDRVGGSTGGFPGFSASYSGTLAYATPWPTRGELIWFDRSGRQVGAPVAPLADYVDFSLAPGEQQLAVSRVDPQVNTSDVWVRDLQRGVETRVTSDRLTDASPMWSPDGSRLYLRSNRRGVNGIYTKPVNGSRDEVLVFEQTGETQSSLISSDLAADGTKLLFTNAGLESSLDVSMLILEPAPRATLLLNSAFNESQAVFSPDGRWIAFTSDETGVPQVFVQSFPGGERRQQVSSRRGSEPQWRRDGRELFFLGEEGELMAAAVANGVAGAPATLFRTRVPVTGNPYRQPYRVSEDGQRFLVNTTPIDTPAPAIHVVLDWRALQGP